MVEYEVRLTSSAEATKSAVTYEYVSAPDTKAGYAIAAQKAEQRLAKSHPTYAYKAVETRCVG